MRACCTRKPSATPHECSAPPAASRRAVSTRPGTSRPSSGATTTESACSTCSSSRASSTRNSTTPGSASSRPSTPPPPATAPASTDSSPDSPRPPTTPPSEFSSGLHAATLCADSQWPWGDASAPTEGRQRALKRAVQQIQPTAVWPFERKTAGAQGIAQTCLPWPASRPNQAAPHRTLTMPVLILAGDRDLSTPVQWARDLAAVTPRAELVVLPGAGHSTQSRSDGGARAAEAFLLR
ncbi:alpha/beta hydrolase [Streptomyces wedmorensis]|uniref:alpha/beta fold hydrolase n=1 Tax=Streptomyces wedmorensis TaxID=43759 RepID=UPI00344A02F3